MRATAPVVACCLLLSHAAQAGDCVSHPLHVFELVVTRCSPLDAKNAAKVSQWVADPKSNAPVASLLKKTEGTVVLEGTLKRSTQLHFDEDATIGTPKPPTVDAWRVEERPVAFLYVPARSAKGKVDVTLVCGAFTLGKAVMVERPTDCSCDTGRQNGTWCWLDDHPVHPMQDSTKKFLKP